MAGDTKSRAGGWLGLALAGAAGVAIGGGAMYLMSGGASDARMKEIVREALIEDPQIIPDAMQELQLRQAAEAIGPRRTQFETPYNGSWDGAQDGDVTLVAFFDYACGYCRRSNEALDRLIAEDPKLKVVWRELPVLGPNSQQAAYVSLAAAEQGKFRPFYHALFSAGAPTEQAVRAAAATAGVTLGQPSDGQRAEIARNVELAQLIGASGTPTFVVGDRVLHGALPYEELKQAVDAARARRAS